MIGFSRIWEKLPSGAWRFGGKINENRRISELSLPYPALEIVFVATIRADKVGSRHIVASIGFLGFLYGGANYTHGAIRADQIAPAV